MRRGRTILRTLERHSSRFESASVPVGSAGITGFTDGGGEIRRRGGKRRILRALRSKGRPLEAVVGRQSSVVSETVRRLLAGDRQCSDFFENSYELSISFGIRNVRTGSDHTGGVGDSGIVGYRRTLPEGKPGRNAV